MIPRTINPLPLRRPCAAFTLVETLVGSVLTVIVFGALLLAISYGYGVMQSSRESLRATQILLARVEGLRLYNWNALINGGAMPSTFTESFSPLQTTNSAAGVLYQGTVTISPVVLTPSPSYAPNMRQVTITVIWTSDNVPRQRSLSTWVSKYGLLNYVYNR